MNSSVASWHEQSMQAPLDERSLQLRRQIVQMLIDGGRGHLGSSLSLVEIIRVLYDDILNYDNNNPTWVERDRCILSKGHGCLPLYLLLAEKGFFPQQELTRVCHLDGLLGGHPDATKVPGVEASTGALGHGLSIGLGMSLHPRVAHSAARVFVIMGDGECNEGSVWEAAMSVGKRGLSKLTVLVDYNKYQSYGPTAVVQDLEPFVDKWRSFGFAVDEVNGHDVTALRNVLQRLPLADDKPSAIICHTVKGKGIAFAENNLAWHHKSKIDAQLAAEMMNALGGGDA